MKFPTLPSRDYAIALAIAAVCTVAALPLIPRYDLVNIGMLYLLGTAVAALRLRMGALVLLALVNMLTFDYFCVPPLHHFNVPNLDYVFPMGVMLFVALVISRLMVTLRRIGELASLRERSTAALYAISRELSAAADASVMVPVAVRHIHAMFRCKALVFLPDKDGRFVTDESSREAARSGVLSPDFLTHVAERNGRTVTEVIYQPMRVGARTIGIIVIYPDAGFDLQPPPQLQLLDALAIQLALALQRAQTAEAAEAARMSTERLAVRNTLLASISHDLRSPLSAIAGAGSLVAQPDYELNTERRLALGGLIEQKARDMSHQLSKILEMMQMEHGSQMLRLDWYPLEDLLEHSLRANEALMSERRLKTVIPANLRVSVDGLLLVKILTNLLENATKYTPPGTTITVSAAVTDGGLALVMEDDGPGLPIGDPEAWFEKFQRGRAESNVTGVGLGLAICRAAARSHGGDIRAGKSTQGGARFEIHLPVESRIDELPDVEIEEMQGTA